MEEQSGVGLVCEWAGRWELVGVATHPVGCGQGVRQRLYDDVTPNTVRWIKKTILAFEQGGS